MNQFKSGRLFVYAVVCALIALTGCKSKKTVTIGGGILAEKSNKEILADALNNEFEYKTLSGKGSIEFKFGNSGQKAPAVYKIMKDKVMQVSVRIPIIGGEAIRMDLTPDSVVIIDRLKKRYLAERFSESRVIANFDFNFYNLQALLTNQLFIPGKKQLSSGDYNRFNIWSTTDMYMLHAKGKGNIDYRFAVDASNHLVSTLIFNEKNQISLQWSYQEFIRDNEQTYPTLMGARAEIGNKKVDINLSYNKLDIDGDIHVDRSIPSKYTKVTFNELIGAYVKTK